jgi:hypothetical protein
MLKRARVSSVTYSQSRGGRTVPLLGMTRSSAELRTAEIYRLDKGSIISGLLGKKPYKIAVLWIRIRIRIKYKSRFGTASESASNKNLNPDPHLDPHQGDKLNPD